MSWGIQAGYHDVFGNWQEPSAPAASAIRRAMGAVSDDPDEPVPASVDLRVVRPGEPPVAMGRAGTLFLEDGTQVGLNARQSLPPDLPLGYHRFEGARGRSAPDVEHVIVAPSRCYLPGDVRWWGLTVQLYAARSAASWGMGDLGDLRRLIGWVHGEGGTTVGLNPIHAATPVGPPANSPYSPSSRRWRDPIYLDMGEPVPAQLDAGADRIDRDAIWTAKLATLERRWASGEPRREPGLAAFRAEHGAGLTLWGTFCAAAEIHGADWRTWPADLRHPNAGGAQRLASERADRVDFWCWLQWLVDEQLAAAGAAAAAITDLAVGFSPDGFDAWQWQDLLAQGCRIGAPPDLLGPDGQDWGLPPFVPRLARNVAYRPLAETLRANLRHTRGLRIDHVMGLLRLFWIPPGHGARDGAYVQWHGTELLDVVALESVRAGAMVIGEDLGTVDDTIRHELGSRGLLSTRLLWFEDDPPEQWPAQAMAAITTHDLPTVAGVWSGVDLADQQAAGVTTPADGDELFRHRLRVAASCDDDAPVDHVVVEAHRRLAAAPSMLATAALDDLMGAEHRPNVPGTIDEHPNWRIPLPVPLDDLAEHPLAHAVVAALRAERSPQEPDS